MSYSCMIVDDEPLSHQVLKDYIRKIPAMLPPVSFFNAEDAKAFLETNEIDLLFLDIQMPEITGLEFIKSLSHQPVTVLSTAYRKYALDGFDLGVADYLLKPIAFERFELAVKRASELLEARKTEKSYEITIKSGTQTCMFDYRTIEYAQGLKDYTILYTKDTKYVVLGCLKNYEKTLPATHFLRVHKSYIVAKTIIKTIHRQRIEWKQVSIPIGRSYKKGVEAYLNRQGPAS